MDWGSENSYIHGFGYKEEGNEGEKWFLFKLIGRVVGIICHT